MEKGAVSSWRSGDRAVNKTKPVFIESSQLKKWTGMEEEAGIGSAGF